MRYGDLKNFQTGVAIPVFSLRSELSCGIGEFLDLIEFGEWCKFSGMDVIQILPVNDTGEERSPYSARSAFALNPVHIRLQDITGAYEYIEQIAEAREQFDHYSRISYVEVVRFKKHILQKIYHDTLETILHDHSLKQWIEQNEWVKAYCIYCYLKEKNQEKSWKEWKAYSKPSPGRIDAFWAKEYTHVLFFAWVQREAEQQLSRASQSLHAMGVRLKGDIPILVNEDSADVWSERQLFDLEHNAGAPPDMYSASGQNWGFPCYNWLQLEKEKFSWWRRRLAYAANFYHAYRIDHVLGFFRIWSIPHGQRTGMMGHFHPSRPINHAELNGIGLPDQTIQYLTHPNYNEEWLSELFGEHWPSAKGRFFTPLSQASHRYVLKNIKNEADIFDLPEQNAIKDALLQVFWNRLFTPDSGPVMYWPQWSWNSAPILQTLPEHEQNALTTLLQQNAQSQERIWSENAQKLLGMMVAETDMLVCAEDLGTIPDCVPDVLAKLDILGLRIERWSRLWQQDEQPFIQPQNYPRLTVASPSCHDCSTIAAWWDEIDAQEKAQYLQEGQLSKDNITKKWGPELAHEYFTRMMQANSLLVIIPLQDWLGLEESLRTTSYERVNVPGTLDATNWTWRMPITISELQQHKSLVKTIKRLTQNRKKQALWQF
jgi:4-alpha-glucanotransferase